MSAKHTPGPWKVHHLHVFKENWSTVKVSSGDNIALDHAIADVDEGPTLEEALANARLIKEAPELVDALTELAAQAQIMNAKQHAGQAVTPAEWAELFALVGRAHSVIDKATIGK